MNKKLIGIALIGVSSVFISGCGIDPTDIQAVMNATYQHYDTHTGSGGWRGPTIDVQSTLFDDPATLAPAITVFVFLFPMSLFLLIPETDYSYFLRNFGGSSSQLYVTDERSTWAFYKEAYSNGKRLDVTLISRDVLWGGGGVREAIGINFSRKELKTLANKELFVFKIVGDKSDLIVKVPGTYFQGFLNKIKQ